MSRLSSALDASLAAGVAAGDVPFASAVLTDAHGTTWEGAAGSFGDGRAADVDSLYVLLSMTKAIGSAAVLLLLDRGLVDLETPVAEVVPEFNEIEVLVDFSATGPVTRPPREPVRLRHLLTHTSGLTYATYHAKQMAWEHVTGAPTFGPTLESFKYPLMFEPGDQFMYGLGPDWVGVMIERIDGRRLDAFCHDEILEPLGMHDTVFEPDGYEDRIAPVTRRTADGSLAITEFRPPSRPEIYSLGGALFGSAPDYARFIRMILGDGLVDGQRLLSPAAVQLMTSNQIGDLRVPPVIRSMMPWSEDVELTPGSAATWTAAFLRNQTDLPNGRGGGSLTWAGFLNTHYWIDPTRQLGGVWMTQVMPFCDTRAMAAYASFERAAYACDV